MRTTATKILDLRDPEKLTKLTLSGLGTRVAQLQFEDEDGWHDFPESSATSSGDTFTAVFDNPPPIGENEHSRVRVELTAGASEVVTINEIQTCYA